MTSFAVGHTDDEFRDIIADFDTADPDNLDLLGGKGGSLAKMAQAGITVPPGHVIKTTAYKRFLAETGLDEWIDTVFAEGLDVSNDAQLKDVGKRIRDKIKATDVPEWIASAIRAAYRNFETGYLRVAVRSSATAEDSEDASFAGEHDTYTNVIGADDVVDRVRACWASLFNDEAIVYRVEHGFGLTAISQAVVVQKMVPAKRSGIMFGRGDNGEPTRVEIVAVYGLGEAAVGSSEYTDSITYDIELGEVVNWFIGEQEHQLTLVDGVQQWIEVPVTERVLQKITLEHVQELGRHADRLKRLYGQPMDSEYAIGEDDIVYLTQARPITTKEENYQFVEEDEPGDEPATLLCKGIRGGFKGAVVGTVRIISGPEQNHLVQPGDILVSLFTTPSNLPALKRCAGIISVKGNKKSHSAIVAGELGIPCVVGAADALDVLTDGDLVTVSAFDKSGGEVFAGRAETRLQTGERLQAQLEALEAEMASVVTTVKPMAILSQPELARETARKGARGIGLCRMETLIGGEDGEGYHPMVYLDPDTEPTPEEYVLKLVAGFIKFCQAFPNDPVVMRLPDFKSNEYRGLTGGEKYEPEEENPMIGWRGVSRYMDQPEILRLELKAFYIVREVFGYTNLWAMAPFVRTVEQFEWLVDFMAECGLSSSETFKIWMMVEVPSNIRPGQLERYIEAGADGFSVGSNDLTQLIFGTDRDSGKLDVADERHEVMREIFRDIGQRARANGVTASICGQAISLYPELIPEFVAAGYTSLASMPASVPATHRHIHQAEQKLNQS